MRQLKVAISVQANALPDFASSLVFVGLIFIAGISPLNRNKEFWFMNEEIKKRGWAYLIAVAIGFVPGLLIGKSTGTGATLSQPEVVNARNVDSASKEKSGYIIDSGLTK